MADAPIKIEAEIDLSKGIARAEQQVESFVRKPRRIAVDVGNGLGAERQGTFDAVSRQAVASGEDVSSWRFGDTAGPTRPGDVPGPGRGSGGRGGPAGAFSNTFIGRGFGTIGLGYLIGNSAFGGATAVRQGRIDSALASGDSMAEFESVMRERERVAGAFGMFGHAYALASDPLGEREASARSTIGLARATEARADAAGRSREFSQGLYRRDYAESGAGDIEQRRRAAENAHKERLEQISKERRAQESANVELLRAMRVDQEATRRTRVLDGLSRGTLQAGGLFNRLEPGWESLVASDAAARDAARREMAANVTTQYAGLPGLADRERARALSGADREETLIEMRRRGRFADYMGDAGVLGLQASGDSRGAQRAQLNNALRSELGGLGQRFAAGDPNVSLSDFAGQFARGFMQRLNQESAFGREDAAFNASSLYRQESFAKRRTGDVEGALTASQSARRSDRLGILGNLNPNAGRINAELNEQDATELFELRRERGFRTRGLEADRDVAGLIADRKPYSAQVESIYRSGRNAADQMRLASPGDARIELQATVNRLLAVQNNMQLNGQGVEVPAGMFGPAGVSYGGSAAPDDSGPAIELVKKFIGALQAEIANSVGRPLREMATDNGM